MTERSDRANPWTTLSEKFRLLRYFLSSLRKRGLWRTLKISMFELYHEYRLGADTSYVISRWRLDGDSDALSHATDYFPSSYLVLHEAFSLIGADCRDAVLVDYGCGMGRALIFASTLPVKRMIGVEISQSLCAAATENLERLYRKTGQTNPSWSIVNGDARAFAIPDDANLIYFFNPFDAEILGRVLDNLIASLRKAPRKCTIIYANPLHESEFSSRGFSKQPTRSKDFSVFTLVNTHHLPSPVRSSIA
jgi:SAM-dependent methyltransferase